MRQPIIIAGAIIVGATIVSGGLYLGLSRRSVVYVTAQTPSVVASEPAPQEVRSPEADSQLAAQVEGALRAQRGRLLKGCQDAPDDHVDALEVRAIFDPNGHLLLFGVNDPPDEQGRRLAGCLRQQTPDLSIPAPGKPVTVQFAMNLR